MDLEAMMAAALGDTVTYEHTHRKAGYIEVVPDKIIKGVRPKRKYDFRGWKLDPKYVPLRDAVAKAHGVDPEYVIGADRSRHTMSARRHFISEMRRRYGFNYSHLGRLLAMDHASIIHNCQKFEELSEHFVEQIRQVNEACP